MAYIDNSETKKEINDAIRGNAVSNIAPTQLANQVIPVIDVNPKNLRRCNIVRAGVASNAISGTIYNTPADKDFFLCSSTISLTKDATSTSTSSRMNVIIDGATQVINRIDGFTLTAQQQTSNITFSTPIRIDRNTSITVTNTTNVANVTNGGTITGYTVEP
jgi:hypothetical protein